MSDDIILKAEDLAVGYENPLIRHICFSLRAGEILTLSGPNGAGKSTLLRTVCGILKKRHGVILIDGREDTSFPPAEKARRMAVLLTDRLHPDMMTCRDVVESGRYPYTGHLGILSADDRRAVEEAIRTVRMSDYADRNFNEISDGQRQRVMLARAICQEPEILILDEPTSYLDISHKIAFLEILRRLTAEKHPAVLVSMHELDFAEKISDYTICVKDGEVFRSGTPDEIFRRDVICELFGIRPGLYDEYFPRTGD